MNRKKRLKKGITSLKNQIEIHKQKLKEAVEEDSEDLARYYEKDIARLEQEEKVAIKKLDVWHDSQAAKLMEKYDCDEKGDTVCGGIPFFVNEETGAKICGNTSYE